VCIGYADFLAETLPCNLPLVDEIVIITSPDDEETQAVCRRNNVRHILSEDFKRGGPFNKGRLINRALDLISGRDWILHADADIVLPRQFRNMLEWAHIDERCIYGADRQRVVGWQKWADFKRYVGSYNNHSDEFGWWLHPDYPMMSRLISSIHGYTPIGCFSLFHGSQIIQHKGHLRRMPVEHGDAARTDHQFSLLWDRRFRVLLPEVVCLHLESEDGVRGANWCGRTTRRFGPAGEMTATAAATDGRKKPEPEPKPKPEPHRPEPVTPTPTPEPEPIHRDPVRPDPPKPEPKPPVKPVPPPRPPKPTPPPHRPEPVPPGPPVIPPLPPPHQPVS
jgi:hypothetical protein